MDCVYVFAQNKMCNELSHSAQHVVASQGDINHL